MIPKTNHLNFKTSPKATPQELTNQALKAFFDNIGLEDCQAYLWQLLTYAVAGKLSQMKSSERLQLMWFLEQLNELLAISSEAYGLKVPAPHPEKTTVQSFTNH